MQSHTWRIENTMLKVKRLTRATDIISDVHGNQWKSCTNVVLRVQKNGPEIKSNPEFAVGDSAPRPPTAVAARC